MAILTQKLRIPKLQVAKHMKLKNKEDQSVSTSFLLTMGNKIPMEGVTETNFRAEMEEMTLVSLVRLCQFLANTELDTHSHLLDGTQGP